MTRPSYKVYIDWWWKEDDLKLLLPLDEGYTITEQMYWLLQQGFTYEFVIADHSKNNLTGTSWNLQPSKGRFKLSFYFNGMDSYIGFNYSDQFSLSGDFSIEIRFLMERDLPEHDFLLVGLPESWEVRIPWSGGRPEFAMFTGDSWYIFQMDYYPEPERFLHLIIVRKRSEGKIQFWLDGELKTELDCPSWIDPYSVENPLYIGGYDSSWDFDCAFRGIIDEVRLYSKALSEFEIKQRYEGVTDDVLSFTISRGKSEELGGRFVAGQFTLDLEDSLGRYTPNNPSSDLYPYIQLNKPIHIEAQYENLIIPLFTGYIDRIIPHPALGQRRVNISGRDKMKDFIGRLISAGPYSDIDYETLILNILSKIGWKGKDADIDTLEVQASFAAFSEEEVISCLEAVAAGGFYAHFIDAEGRYQFRNMGFYFALPYKEFDAFESFDIELSDADVINHARIEAQPRELQSDQLIWELPSSFSLSPGESKVMEIEFHDYTTGGRRYASSPHVQSFSAEDEFGNALSQIDITITSTESSSATLEVTNNGSVTAIITSIQVYGRPFKVLPRIIAERSDSDSIERFFKRSFSYSNDIISSSHQAESIAELIVLRNAEPMSRISCSLKDRFPDLIFIDLGTLLRIKQDFLHVDDYFQVESLDLRVQRGGLDSILELRLKRSPKRQAFIIGETELGKGVLL